MGSPPGCNTYETFLGNINQTTGGKSYNTRENKCNWLYTANFWYNEGTQINCLQATGLNCGAEGELCCPHQPLVTPTGSHAISDTSKANSRLRGSRVSQPKQNPWQAPGYSPLADPCGILGGWNYPSPEDYIAGPLHHGNMTSQVNGQVPPPGLKPRPGTFGTHAFLASDSLQPAAVWQAGNTAEISWSLLANHGGGYQYRLCPKGKLAEGEDCFQRMPLDFANETGWIQWSNGTRKAFAQTRVAEGVKPPSSTWTLNPVPECKMSQNGHCKPTFDEPVPGVFGEGSAYAQCQTEYLSSGSVCSKDRFAELLDLYNFTVVDAVKVPEGLTGDFVLSWRWDSGTTPQVWSNCASVKIE